MCCMRVGSCGAGSMISKWKKSLISCVSISCVTAACSRILRWKRFRKVSVLDRQTMVDRIRAKDLVVSPILSEEQLGLSSIDLRMGTIVLAVRGRGLSHVDPENYTKPADDIDAVVGKRQ